MKEEHRIIQQVYKAKKDMEAADRLISAYIPFIRSETAKFLKRPPVEGQDDELSIAMIAFHEAVRSYSRLRGSFIKYAAVVIKSRLIDYRRRESRHEGVISLHTASGEKEQPLEETLTDGVDHGETIAVRDATRKEIEELSRQMKEFGVSFSDVAEHCPQQERTLTACRKALEYAREDGEILDILLRTKRLPVTQLARGSGVERKTLERHRKYMIALLLIYTNGYEMIRGHLGRRVKGGTAL